MVNISVGCVDDNNWYSPQMVVYAKDRPMWDVTSKNIPNFDRMPPAAPARGWDTFALDLEILPGGP